VTDTSGLKLKVIFRTVQHVLAGRRTRAGFKPTTICYLNSAKEILEDTADAMEAIADNRMPRMSGRETAQEFFLSHAETIATASRTADRDLLTDPSRLRKYAHVLRDFADCVEDINAGSEKAYKVGDHRVESLKAFADAVVNTASKTDATANNVETVVTL